MVDTGTPPVIPAALQLYNSYVVDPQWQRKFSVIWPSFLAFLVLLSLPHLIRSIRNGRAYNPLPGISEHWNNDKQDYTVAGTGQASSSLSKNNRRRASLQNLSGALGSVFYWTIPGLNLNAGQILILVAYAVTVIICIVSDAQLIDNSNRPGFIALAQFPVVFLFSTKNSLVSLVLGPGNGYEKLNFIHRWSGRVMFLAAVLHGSLWIRNHLQYGIPILGQQKETSGVAALSVLSIIVISSIKPVRRICYEIFFIIHFLAFVAFFITICYHTIYASPWIFPPLAFYGLDILMRMFRHRIKDAVLVPIDNQMTLIHVPYSTTCWIAGQHVRLRVFFSGRIFESHPLTIFSATPDVSCITSMPQGISFGVRVVGDWTRALNRYASMAAAQTKGLTEKDRLVEDDQFPSEVPVQVMIDGPYGGCGVDLGDHETVLLFAGGSGITFTLGLLDDIVGRCTRKGRSNGERTRRIEFAWCIRSFGCIEWFSSALMDIATAAAASSTTSMPIDLHISIYVTCLCDPEAVPAIPNSDVTMIRPSIYQVLNEITSFSPPPTTTTITTKSSSRPISPASNENGDAASDFDIEESAAKCSNQFEGGRNKLCEIREGGGVAVCASGPASLTREAANAVARLQMSGRGMRLGGIALHTELFSL
ncbi:hypothetical protein BYT27DRAFT_7132472 [Phlegmacium glaucopus]|nr:hypothetical protein BYT27DRAFT_7132472 [Phlegmacium glaucopus]